MSDEECRYCGSKRVVPVLDKRIERSPTAGNKYRTQCRNCRRWLPMTSEAHFRNHPEPHVLPADADPDEDGSVIPLEEYDYGPEWDDLAQRVDGGGPDPVATDGGEAVEDEPEDDDEQQEEDQPDNRFECPATGCEAVVEGYPDECPECGAPYEW